MFDLCSPNLSPLFSTLMRKAISVLKTWQVAIAFMFGGCINSKACAQGGIVLRIHN